MSDYGYSVEVPEGYDEAILRSRLALKSEGFSIITEMHVGGLLGPEAGEEREYLIMGAWGTGSQRSLDSDIEVAVHLPCNVVGQETGSSAVVAALDPADSVEIDNPSSSEMAAAARDALGRVFNKVVTFR